MNLDLTITVSVIIALCAIISPILVSIINNHYQLKLKQIEIVKDHKAQAFEAYLNALEKCIRDKRNSTLVTYGQAFGNALLYASSSTQSVMIEIDTIISSAPFDSYKVDINKNLIQKVCKKLQNYMNI